MTSTERRTWLNLKNLVAKFLRNVQSPEWKKKISRMVDSLKNLKCLMSSKLYFMNFNDEYSPEDLDTVHDKVESFKISKWWNNDIMEAGKKISWRTTVGRCKGICLRRKVKKGKCRYKGLLDKKVRYNLKNSCPLIQPWNAQTNLTCV